MTDANVRSYIADFLPLATFSYLLCWLTSPCFSCVKLSRGYCEAIQCPGNTVDRHSGSLDSTHSSYMRFTYQFYIRKSMEQRRFENLILPQLVKKYPTFYGTRSIIRMFTPAQHFSLSWIKLITSMFSGPVSVRYIVKLSSIPCLGLPGISLLQISPSNVLWN